MKDNTQQLRLRKSADFLVFQPGNIPYALGTVDRRLFNVLILTAMKMKSAGAGPRQIPGMPGDDLWYSAPVTEIAQLMGLVVASLNYEQLRISISNLMRVVVDLPILEKEAGAYEGIGKPLFRGRHLISKGDIIETNGRLFVYWSFEKEVEPRLMNPDRYALLRLSSITSLSTPKSIALYEICARYVNATNGSTGAWPWEWWVGALTGQLTKGPKRSKTFSQFRYFNSKVIQPAKDEINEKTEITIDLVAPKVGGRVVDISFTVKRKSDAVDIGKEQAPDVDLRLIVRAKAIKVTEKALLDSIKLHGVEMVEKALSACESAMQARSDDQPIRSMNAYFSGVLKKMLSKAEGGQSELALADATPTPAAPRPSLPAPAPAPMKPRLPAQVDADKGESLADLSALSAEQLEELIKATIERVEAEAKDRPVKGMFLARTVKDLREHNFVALAGAEVRKQLQLMGANQ